MNPYQTLMDESWEANMELAKSGLVIHTFGNVSSLDADKGVFAIKPSGVPYCDLKSQQMVVVDLEANVVSGNLRPSSDTKTHAVLYREFNGLGGICHTHSTYATAWAQAIHPIPPLGTTHADHVYGNIPCTKIMSDEAIKGDYETETAYQILNAFKKLSPLEVEMVLVACHGPFTWGKTAQKSVDNAVVLEELARMAFLTVNICPDVGPLKKALLDKHYLRKHGKNKYYGQE